MSTTLSITMPDKCREVLTADAVYKVLYGGRGSGKSWSAARKLLGDGVARKERILCTREVQKTIRDSVHKLLVDQIEALGLGFHYDVTDQVIRGRNGTEFLFNGLSNVTAGTVKSFEGVTKCWCEEAQTITKNSWEVLIPTILRRDTSEIIITFNPDLETDPTYQQFVISPPPDTVSRLVNWSDNPDFPPRLNDSRLHCLATQPLETYNNIWEGAPRFAAAGAIFANEVSAAYVGKRVCNLPYDPMLKVHTVWDLGFGDYMAVAFVQVLRTEVRIIDYIHERQKRTDEIGAMVLERRYNLGSTFLPHDGFHATRGLGKSDADVLRGMRLPNILKTPNLRVEERIRVARNNFYKCYFDANRTQTLLECLKRYRRAETRTGGDGSPVHDPDGVADGADCFAYAMLNLNRMTNDGIDGNDHYTALAPRLPGHEPSVGSMGY